VTKQRFSDEDFLALHSFVIGDKLSPVIGLSEEAMRGRVTMLKRMKRLLIVDWHPVIDILLGDYERNLRRVELLREPDNDPDPQDRDFDIEQGE
jgi:hypothetical protein